MTRKRSTSWPLIIVSLGFVFLTGLIGLVLIAAVVGGGGGSGQHVALINFYGAISDTESGQLFGERGPQDFIRDLETARRDPSVKAVVLRINSPGGSASASQELYRAIQRVRADKPVVCSMGDVAASGGYYMAAACDKIYANPATVTGSIGVITQFINLQQLMQKLGVNDATITSGKFKDAGSPFRNLRPDERALFQEMIRDIYGQFLDDVVAGRKAATNGKLTKAALVQVADGRVLTGRQAKNRLLVDELGGLREAVEAAGKLGGIEGTPLVRKVSGGGGFGSLLGTEASSPLDGFSALAAAMGSAFAKGFSQTLSQQLREDAGHSAVPQLK